MRRAAIATRSLGLFERFSPGGDDNKMETPR
jgi:hypothetical protein